MAGKPQPKVTITCACGQTREVGANCADRVTRCPCSDEEVTHPSG